MNIIDSKIHDREEQLMKSLTTFFSEPSHIDIIKPIIEGKDISLRVLDWFVTNYAKNRLVVYPITYKLRQEENKITGRIEQFDVWTEYKSQLKSFSKEMFDPFCRLENDTTTKEVKKKRTRNKCRKLMRFYYNTGEGDYLETTLGQLNFFRWIITNKILDYIKDHIEDIEEDMIKVHKEKNNKKKKKDKDKESKGIKIKMGNSSITALNTQTKNKTRIIVSFD